MTRSLLIILLIFSLTTEAKAQNFEWQDDVEKMLSEFLSCGGLTPPNKPCNTFLRQALKSVYKINDFDNGSGEYISANDIAAYVLIHTDIWTLLGDASSQKVLDDAQGYAKFGKAVIAVQPNPSGHGHVALILPGSQQYSGNWNLKCPNSASFFLNKPNNSYAFKPLSYAFTTTENVKIYGRNF